MPIPTRPEDRPTPPAPVAGVPALALAVQAALEARAARKRPRARPALQHTVRLLTGTRPARPPHGDAVR